jgi:hypothetical protein
MLYWGLHENAELAFLLAKLKGNLFQHFREFHWPLQGKEAAGCRDFRPII